MSRQYNRDMHQTREGLTTRRNAAGMAAWCTALGMVGVVHAQTPGPELEPALRAHVEFLADDLLEGRGTGSRGHALAAAYVAAQFKQLGLQPFGDALADEQSADGSPPGARSFLQDVHLLEATPVLPGSTAKLTRNGGSTTFEYGTDYLPLADFSAPNSTLTAPLVFVGFGVTAPELGYDDLANVDVRDRIAIVLTGAPGKFPRDQRAYYAWKGEKYANLVEHGALGVIVIDAASTDAATSWERRVKMSWRPQMRWLDRDDMPVDAYPELKQRFIFSRQAAKKLFIDAPQTLEQILATAAGGEPQAFALPGLMTLTTTTGLRRTESSNVVGLLRGSDAKLRRQYIVISAHLDHLGRGATVDGDAIYNGAQDNAAGVAIMLETARMILADGATPKRSILFLAATAGEYGSLGSDYFAHNTTLPGNGTLVADLNIDTPQTFGPTRDIVVLGGDHSTLGAIVRHAAAQQGYRIGVADVLDDQRLIASDQFAFMRHGVPSAYLMDGYTARPGGPDIKALRQEYFRKRYMQPSDDLTSPPYWRGMADLTQIYVRIALDLADRSDRPYWLRDDFFASKFAPRP